MEFLVPYMTNRQRESNIVSDDDSDYEELSELSRNVERESDEVANPNADNENAETESVLSTNAEVENVANEYPGTDNMENENTVTEETEHNDPDNVDIAATSVESTESPASNTKTATPKTKRTKKDDITSLIKQSIQQHEERAQRRATERKNLEQLRAPNDDLYHFFMSMYKITKKMPQASQHIVRNGVFQAVSQVEADLLNNSSSTPHSTHSSISMPLSSPLSYYDNDSRDMMSPPQSVANANNTLINYINAFAE